MNDSTQETRRSSRKRRTTVTGCVVAVPVEAPAVITDTAAPSSATGVAAEQLATGTSEGPLTIGTPGRVDVTMSRVTIEPGGTTGWHYHPGPVVGVVRSGTLTRTLAEGTVEVSGPGSIILEPAGREHAHMARNLGTEPVELHVTYFVPAGSPLAVEATPPDGH
ncbi:cupin domain-containing protein [Streptomyces sparsus]